MPRMIAVCVIVVALAPPVRAAAANVIDGRTPWRAFLVTGGPVYREAGQLKARPGTGRNAMAPFDPTKAAELGLSPLPAGDWTSAAFDDRHWPRYLADDIEDALGGYGPMVQGGGRNMSWPVMLALRTSFGVEDPGVVGDLVLTVRCVGGGVAYVNGREVGRAFVPPGEANWATAAEDYPLEAYTMPDGKTALPTSDKQVEPEPELLARYEKRLRTFTIAIPAGALVEGRNVLAVALHRAAIAGPVQDRTWGHVGFRDVALTSASGRGVVPYEKALEGTRVWNAQALEQVADAPAEQSLINRPRGRNILWARGLSFRGIQVGNPYDDVGPVRLAVARNGTRSAQVVVSDLAGLRDVSATLSELSGPGGAAIPAGAVKVRYAVQQTGSHYCDALLERAPDGAKTVPVWLIVDAPKDQAPGWYEGTLAVRANGKQFPVRVQVLVNGLVLPDARDFSSNVYLNHSAETVAMRYGVAPWSDEHFGLIGRSLAMLGQVGNDVVEVPVVLGNGIPVAKDWIGDGGARGSWRLPMVRWVAGEGGALRPDFAVLERFLDLYARHNAPPKAISLYLWDATAAGEMADAYENRRVASKAYKPKRPMLVHKLDPATGRVEEIEAPPFTAPEAERFWKPMLDGVRQVVTGRGWDERVILLGLGGDMRPGQKTGEALRAWAPYARWDILSHFSGDPAPRDGRMIATGGLDVGLKEWPWVLVGSASPVNLIEKKVAEPAGFLEISTNRWHHEEFSPPLTFRTMTLITGDITRLGLDFWLAGPKDKPKNVTFFNAVNALTVAGPAGAEPTVRFQQFREGVQDEEVRRIIIREYLKRPEDQRAADRALLDEVRLRVSYGARYLGQQELALDWASYVVRLEGRAAELRGENGAGDWQKAPE